MAELLEVIRSLHLLFAVLWGGGSMYHGLITMKFLHDQHNARRQWWTRSKFGPFLGITSMLTVVSGLWVFFLVGAETYTRSEMMVLGLGMTAGIIGMLIGWGGHLPAAIRLARAVKEDEESTIQKLEAREELLDKFGFFVVAIAILAMVTFRLF